jgi:hypothetical protein
MSNDFDPDWPHGHACAGLPARIICKDAKGPYPVVALVKHVDGVSEVARFFTLSGEGTIALFSRIINAPAPKRKFVRWVNFYEAAGLAYPYGSRGEAAERAGSARTACIRVEFEEGDGL